MLPLDCVSRSTLRNVLRSDRTRSSGIKCASLVRAQHAFPCLAYTPRIPRRNVVGSDPDIRLPKGHRLTEYSRQGTAVPWNWKPRGRGSSVHRLPPYRAVVPCCFIRQKPRGHEGDFDSNLLVKKQARSRYAKRDGGK